MAMYLNNLFFQQFTHGLHLNVRKYPENMSIYTSMYNK